jgi:hypothetical protein
MRTTKLLAIATVVAATSFNIALAGPADARPAPVRGGSACVEKAGASARGGHGPDHREVSAKEQRAIARQTKARLDARGVTRAELQATSVSVPVYVHVMAAEDGSGNVTDRQVRRQIAVLNNTFAGGESSTAADTRFSFVLAGTDRYFNNVWHKDHSSSTYRKATRQGGADALNIWLVDFKLLGVATFPWDYAKNGDVDGIRVHYASLPGGDIANYDKGETATHEAGHWLGLYHTFQGGCTELNDEVSDTPAQSSPTNGCPIGRDSCSLPGLDPIHNYMDYSYDSCYTEFTSGQTSRAHSMWAAYRG